MGSHSERPGVVGDHRKTKLRNTSAEGLRPSVIGAISPYSPQKPELSVPAPIGGVLETPQSLVNALKQASREILIARDSLKQEQESMNRTLIAARGDKLLRLREECRARHASSAERSERIEALETKREKQISAKRQNADNAMAVTIKLEQDKLNLDQKQRENRLREAKLMMLSMFAREAKRKFWHRKDQLKHQIRRDRNVEIRMEVRQRRLREAAWLKERQRGSEPDPERFMSQEPKPNCNASIVESVKTCKTASSKSVSKNSKQHEELMQEKHEFLARVDRDERIREKLANKPAVHNLKTPAQIEVDRFVEWKSKELEKRTRILESRLALIEAKASDAKLRKQKTLEAIRSNLELEERRKQLWTASEKQKNQEVVERAVSRVCGLEELIPSIF
jgi:hypothetical protein